MVVIERVLKRPDGLLVFLVDGNFEHGLRPLGG